MVFVHTFEFDGSWSGGLSRCLTLCSTSYTCRVCGMDIGLFLYSVQLFFDVFSGLLREGKEKNKYSNYFLALFFISGCLAILSSEKAYVLPLLIVLYEWFFGSIKKNLNVIIGTFSMLLITFAMLYSQLQIRIGAFTGIIAEGNGDLYLNPLIQIPYVLGTYIQLIFWPERLTLYRLDEMGIPIFTVVSNTTLLILYIVSTIVANKKIKLYSFSFHFSLSLRYRHSFRLT